MNADENELWLCFIEPEDHEAVAAVPYDMDTDDLDEIAARLGLIFDNVMERLAAPKWKIRILLEGKWNLDIHGLYCSIPPCVNSIDDTRDKPHRMLPPDAGFRF